ncbi:hypothetical protein [Streptomyces sp. NPDC101178]|uniref:hypothetical protein n=1 Tax=Streptomyces sp. NPDC101178 TaxID=3366124 RepID=UPI0038014E8C
MPAGTTTATASGPPPPPRAPGARQAVARPHLTAGYEHFTAGPDARLAITYRAKNANLVLAGTGKVTVVVDGKATRTIDVSGSPTLYRLTDDKDPRTARLGLRLDEGPQAYAFTFGWSRWAAGRSGGPPHSALWLSAGREAGRGR